MIDIANNLNTDVLLCFKKKTLKGVIKSNTAEKIVFDSDDFGVIEIPVENIEEVLVIQEQDPVYIFTCKNNVGCKGIRYLGVDEKLFPCKFRLKYECSLDKICDFNRLPLELRKQFLNGMSTPIPIKEK